MDHYDTRVVGKQDAVAPHDVLEDPSLQTMRDVDAAVPRYFDQKLGFHSDALYARPFGGRWPDSEESHSD